MREEKKLISQEYLGRLSKSPFFIVVDYTGLKVGPLTTLPPGGAVSHRETWKLFRNVPRCRNEADVDRLIRPLV